MCGNLLLRVLVLYTCLRLWSLIYDTTKSDISSQCHSWRSYHCHWYALAKTLFFNIATNRIISSLVMILTVIHHLVQSSWHSYGLLPVYPPCLWGTICRQLPKCLTCAFHRPVLYERGLLPLWSLWTHKAWCPLVPPIPTTDRYTENLN